MNLDVSIVNVCVATIRGALPFPVVLGDWNVRDCECAFAGSTNPTGHQGWAFTLAPDQSHYVKEIRM